LEKGLCTVAYYDTRSFEVSEYTVGTFYEIIDLLVETY